MGRGKSKNHAAQLRKSSGLLSRDDFRESVFSRDNNACVVCGDPADAAHHLIERKLWPDGGYYLDNGVSLCESCHLEAESTELSVEDLREAAGIETARLPETFTEGEYTKWGDPIIAGQRYVGPLFYDEGVQKILGSRVYDYKEYFKYPRTGHLPWSRSRGRDDIGFDTSVFEGQEVVVTEKIDGENTTIYPDGHTHARSLDSGYHVSRTRVRAFAAGVAAVGVLPPGWRLCCENISAEHTIKYSDDAPYLFIHSIWDNQRMLGRDEMESFFETLRTNEYLDMSGVALAPLLYRGDWDEEKIRSAWTKQGAYGPSEGYVVKPAEDVLYEDFNESVAKYVSDDFVVKDGDHWMSRH